MIDPVFMESYGWPAIWMLAHIGAIVGVILGLVAYYTYGERKVMGAMQRRQGPMTVGPFGLLQPIADGIKLLSKETIIPSGANRGLFLIAPIVTFTTAATAPAGTSGARLTVRVPPAGTMAAGPPMPERVSSLRAGGIVTSRLVAPAAGRGGGTMRRI